MSIVQWFLLSRPKTLTASFVPVLVAYAYVWSEGLFRNSLHEGLDSLSVLFVTLLSCTCIQVATNFFNDLIDFRRGVDDQERLGPKRALQQGLIQEKQLWRAAFTCVAFALITGAYLVYIGGAPILIIGLCSLLLAYGYTGGPLPLAYNGLGDFFVILFFGLVAVCGSVFLFSASLPIESGVLGLQIGLLATVLIAINNLRDREKDKQRNKITLAVILGESGAKVEIALLLFSPFLLGIYWGFDPLFYLPLLLSPLAVQLLRLILATEPGESYNSFLAKSALLHALFGCMLVIALVLRGSVA